jgi:apolipoprotein N-acyltransferase
VRLYIHLLLTLACLLLIACLNTFGFLSLVFLVPILFFFEQTVNIKVKFIGGFLLGASLVGLSFAGLVNLNVNVYVVLTFTIGFFYGLTTLLVNRGLQESFRQFHLFMLLISWVTIEYLASSFPLLKASAIPLSFGYAIINTPFSEITNVSGVHGASVFLLTFNYLTYLCLKKQWSSKYLYTSLGIVVALWFGSLFKVEEIHVSVPLRVALIEPGISRETDYLSNQNTSVSEALADELQTKTSGFSSDVAIFPESTLNIITDVEAFADTTKSHIIISGGSRTDDRRLLYNSVYTKDGQNKKWLRDKYILVPHFENNYTAGFEGFIPFKADGIDTLVLICWESVFESQIRLAVNRQQNVITVISNDTFADGTPTPQWHFRTSQLLAATLGRYVIYSSQKGPSGIFRYDGKEIIPTKVTKGVKQYKVTFDKSFLTLYRRFGDWIGPLCLVTFFISLYLFLNKILRSATYLRSSKRIH